MQRDDTSGEVTAPPADDRSPTRGPRLSRRQAIGRMSAVATAGAAAWVVPEILTAKPASGASLSGPVGTGSTGGTGGTGASVGVSTNAGTTGGTGEPQTSASTTSSGSASTGSAGAGVGTRASTSPNALAFTGLDIQRDAEVGAALVAGGWAMHHWASRAPKPAVVVDGVAEPGSTDTVH